MKKLAFSFVSLAVTLSRANSHQMIYPHTTLNSFNHSNRLNVTIALALDSNPSTNLIDILDSYGVRADDYSKIFSHQEKNTINLQCFDCIINIRNHDAKLESPENDQIKRQH